jgi:hypothetical protein
MTSIAQPDEPANRHTRRSAQARRPRSGNALAALLNDIESYFTRYVSFTSRDQVTAAVMWAAQSHATEAASYLYHLNIYSPVARCGKSRLATVIGNVSCHPRKLIMTTAAGLYRDDMPGKTWFIEEANDALRRKDTGADLYTLLKAASEYGLEICRIVDNEPKTYHTFAPICCIGVGRITEPQSADRCIPVNMQRTKRGEIRAHYNRLICEAEGSVLRERLAECIRPHMADITNAEPYVTLALAENDRAVEWGRVILAISDLAGNGWPERVREDMAHLVARADTADESERLLADIRAVMRPGDKLPTHELMSRLIGYDGNPEWSARWLESRFTESRRGAMDFARMLSAFDIKSKDIKFNGKSRKGFDYDMFADAFARYLPAQNGDN